MIISYLKGDLIKRHDSEAMENYWCEVMRVEGKTITAKVGNHTISGPDYEEIITFPIKEGIGMWDRGEVKGFKK